MKYKALWIGSILVGWVFGNLLTWLFGVWSLGGCAVTLALWAIASAVIWLRADEWTGQGEDVEC